MVASTRNDVINYLFVRDKSLISEFSLKGGNRAKIVFKYLGSLQHTIDVIDERSRFGVRDFLFG